MHTKRRFYRNLCFPTDASVFKKIRLQKTWNLIGPCCRPPEVLRFDWLICSSCISNNHDVQVVGAGDERPRAGRVINRDLHCLTRF